MCIPGFIRIMISLRFLSLQDVLSVFVLLLVTRSGDMAFIAQAVFSGAIIFT